MTPTDALAVARLTRAWTVDAYDFPPLTPIHDRAEKLLSGTRWEKLLDCPWCTSFWVAGSVILFRRVAPRSWAVLASMLAASQVAGMLHDAEEAL